ncbi:MAG: hypothetical protein HQK53_11385 [Oligoflexia bacterium]|nr:hypothetical protein [Oligoflexia bacterium]
MINSRTSNTALTVLVALVIVVYGLAAFFSTGYNHFDEHFQILEFSQYKMGVLSKADLPWEFKEQMRSALQPSMVYLLQRIFSSFDPFTIAFILRLLSATLSICAATLLTYSLKPMFPTFSTFYNFHKSSNEKKFLNYYILITFFTWFGVLQAVRFSSENWSGQFFVIGLAILLPSITPRFTLFASSYWRFLFTGFCLGLAFCFRYHTGILIAGLLLWSLFIGKIHLRFLLTIVLGICSAITLELFVDRWFYGNWVLPQINYFVQTLVLDKVSSFGIEPWWFYFWKVFIRAIPPIGLTIIIAFFYLIITKPKSMLVWVTVPFLLIHTGIGHKEIRFVFPLIPLIPLLFLETAQLLISHPRLAKFLLVCNGIALLIIIFRPVDNYISVYQQIYRDYPLAKVLYTTAPNPYQRILPITYYKRPTLKVIETPVPFPICSQPSVCLFITNTESSPPKNSPWRLVFRKYEHYPSFVKKMLSPYSLYYF